MIHAIYISVIFIIFLFSIKKIKHLKFLVNAHISNANSAEKEAEFYKRKYQKLIDDL